MVNTAGTQAAQLTIRTAQPVLAMSTPADIEDLGLKQTAVRCEGRFDFLLDRHGIVNEQNAGSG